MCFVVEVFSIFYENLMLRCSVYNGALLLLFGVVCLLLVVLLVPLGTHNLLDAAMACKLR